MDDSGFQPISFSPPPLFSFSALNISFYEDALYAYLFQERFPHHRSYKYHCFIIPDDDRYSKLNR